MKSRTLTDEERATWREATKYDEKFHADAEGVSDVVHSDIVIVEQETTPNIAPVIVQKKRHYAPITLQHVTGTDGTTAKRLKQGKLTIERSIDLHGCTREEAFLQLCRLLPQWAENHIRVVEIITGKGRAGAQGVLKEQLPHWLNDALLRRYIISASYAPINKGGVGAVLVLLRRIK